MFRDLCQEREFWPAKSHCYPLPFKQPFRHSKSCPERVLITEPYIAVIRTEQELTLFCVTVLAMNSSAVSQFIIPPPPPPPHKIPERAEFSCASESVRNVRQVEEFCRESVGQPATLTPLGVIEAFPLIL